MTAIMQAQKQQFTFIDAAASKEVNKRRVKSHVAFDTNRRKRREAVTVHQNSRSLTPDAGTISGSSPASSTSSNSRNAASPPPIFEEVDSLTPSTISVTTPGSVHQAQLILQPFTRSPSPVSLPDPGTDHDREDDGGASIQGLGLSNVVVSQNSLQSKRRPHRAKVSSLKPTEVARFGLPGASSTTRISPYMTLPQELLRVEIALRQTKFFLQNRYDTTWALKTRETPHFYDIEYEVSNWRETFFIANSLISSGRTHEGFLVLNEALEIGPTLLRQQHPHLLLALLELNLAARNWKDLKIQTEVNSHLGQIATLILGHKHPITMLLGNEFAGDEKRHAITEALFTQNVDTLRSLFGSNAYSPLSAQIALAQYVASRGSFPRAYSNLDEVSQGWGALFSPESPAMKLVAFERAKVRALETRDPRSELQSQLSDLVNMYEAMKISTPKMTFEEQTHDPTQPTTETLPKASLDIERRKLATWLMSRSCHALAMHTYFHLDEIFDGQGPESPDWPEIRTRYSMSTNVVKIVLVALRNS